jgi:hypothetical protein
LTVGDARNEALYEEHGIDDPVPLDEAVAVGEGISREPWWCSGYFPGEPHGPHVEDADGCTVAIAGAGPCAEANTRLMLAAPRLRRQVVALYGRLADAQTQAQGVAAEILGDLLTLVEESRPECQEPDGPGFRTPSGDHRRCDRLARAEVSWGGFRGLCCEFHLQRWQARAAGLDGAEPVDVRPVVPSELTERYWRAVVARWTRA